jgi:hypothetical protein
MRNVLGLVTALASLLHRRARMCVAVLTCLASILCAVSIASAHASAPAKTRVWDFSSAAPLNIRLNALASTEQRPRFFPAQSELASVSPHAARGANTAFDIAKAGGRHAGLLKTYAGRSAAELQKGIASLERQAATHAEKVANPARFAERWGQMGAREQAGLVRYWQKEAANYGEQAEVLRGLLGSL